MLRIFDRTFQERRIESFGIKLGSAVLLDIFLPAGRFNLVVNCLVHWCFGNFCLNSQAAKAYQLPRDLIESFRRAPGQSQNIESARLNGLLPHPALRILITPSSRA